MGWYQALYEGDGRGEGPSGPRPKGLRLLAHILRWHWWTLVKANILFCLFCLPVLTIPAALKALTRVCVLLLRGEPLDLWPDWWAAFRRGFGRTTAAGAAMAVLAFLAALAAAYLLAFPYSTFVLASIAFSLFWLAACFAAWSGLERYVFRLSGPAGEDDG